VAGEAARWGAARRPQAMLPSPPGQSKILVSFQGRRPFVPDALTGVMVLCQGFSGMLCGIRDCGVTVLGFEGMQSLPAVG